MWLVRTETNQVLQILGPFSKEKVCQMILDGELGPQAEVCEANNYWIYLHETDELVRQLGIQPPRSLLSGEDATQTQTKTEPDLERTDPDLKRPAPSADAGGESGSTMAPRTPAEAPPLSAPVAVVVPVSTPAPAPTPAVAPPAANPTPAQQPIALSPIDTIPQSPIATSGPRPAPSVIYRPMVLGDIQRQSAWRAVLLVLLAFAAVAIVLVVVLLRR